MTGAHRHAAVIATFLPLVAELSAAGADREARSRAGAALRSATAGMGFLFLHPAAGGLLATSEAVARGDLAAGQETTREVLAGLERLASALGVKLADLPEYRRLPRDLRGTAFRIAVHDLAEFAMPAKEGV